MTPQEETEMHELAMTLAQLTEGTGWEMMRYMAIGQVLEHLTRYCATCPCQDARNKQASTKGR